MVTKAKWIDNMKETYEFKGTEIPKTAGARFLRPSQSALTEGIARYQKEFPEVISVEVAYWLPYSALLIRMPSHDKVTSHFDDMIARAFWVFTSFTVILFETDDQIEVYSCRESLVPHETIVEAIQSDVIKG